MTDKSTDPAREWLCYDGDCEFCQRWVARLRPILEPRGVEFITLQTPWVRERLGLAEPDSLREMVLLARDQRSFGGGDALIELARRVWWAWPIFVLAKVPGGHALSRLGYRWVASRWHCHEGACRLPKRKSWPAWVPLIGLPALVAAFLSAVAPWVFLCAMAAAIFCGCKWLTWWPARRTGGTRRAARSLGYLFLWPGMDAHAFLDPARRPHRPLPREWCSALGRSAAGAALVWVGTRLVPRDLPLAAGWVGLLGLILFVHFGLFHLAALLWQRAGVAAEPIMRSPWRSRSLGDFWGERWNRAFRDVAHACVFRPLRRPLGGAAATMIVFLVSGLVHELVISLPARAGYGLPASYFLLQGAGVLAERMPLARRAGWRRRGCGWLVVVLVAGGPAFWLFHPAFVREVVLPFLAAIAAVSSSAL